ncbi:MAG: PBP1A family penicillin-binding protein [Patescibacteria group bacterium]|nr:PBP1A family penicillin-binding protein [Patescibacteria group bacterium]MDD4610688.1 PBP1A family penicillin-binding protein [Patescibacteria group bacterium]
MKYASLTLFVLILVGFISLARLSSNLPSPNQLMERQVAQSTKIYDRTGENILYEVHGDAARTIVKLNELPDYVKQATIAIEDKDFYNHGAFSLWAMFRSAVKNIFTGSKVGGSTLTQQFIKNAVLSPEKTYTRKIKELILAYRLEEKFSKDEILQMYFNEIPYGSTAYGIESASQKYFGKSVRDVNLAEAAILAAMTQAPSRYSPYGPNKDELIARQHYILDLMVEQKYITEPKAEAAKQFALEFKPPSEGMIAPHFVMYVKGLLSEKYGEKTIEQEGLKIYTTLDLYKQKIAEEVITEKVENNEKKYNASNAALISIDPKTGQILAMVGSRNYFDTKIDGQVNVTTSARQPGSSIKPIVYAASFIKGYTPNTILYDVVTNFSTDPANPYEPHNYDGAEHGPVTMRKALAGSLNIPAVKTIYLTGIDNVLSLTKDLGYSTLNDRNRFGLSLVLGGGEVKLIEHANAFSAFAREGELNAVSAILKVEDKDGNILEEYKENKRKVLDSQVAREINSILSDNDARSYVFGAENYLTLPNRPVCAKTGTTNDYRDAWTIGYTPSIVTGVWVGNNDNSEMNRGADGSVVAAPIWNAYMQRVLGNTPVENFKPMDDITTGKPVLDGQIDFKTPVKIDRASGLLATEYTPESFIEEKRFSQPHCILYYINKDDPRGSQPKNPADDPQFNLWESRVKDWAAKNGYSTSNAAAPTEYDNLHKPENQPTFNIKNPSSKETISQSVITATIEGSAPRGINRAEYYIDDNLFSINSAFPFNLEKDGSLINNGFHTLKVRVCDDIDNCSEKSVEINYTGGSQKKSGRIGVSISSPGNGIALNTGNFPLVIGLTLTNPAQTARVNIYVTDKDNQPAIKAVAQPISSTSATAYWRLSPPPGTYKIYAEAIGWQGQKDISNNIQITISE